jgi:hypothetical protein
MQMIENAKQKQRDPTQQIEVRVSGHGLVVLGNRHDDTPDHAGNN